MFNYNLSNNTGAHTGIIFSPFSSEIPSDYSNPFSHKPAGSARRSPIVHSEEGWTEAPDTGGTSLERSAALPIGNSDALYVMAFLYALWKYIRSKRHVTLMVLLLSCLISLNAAVTSLTFTPSAPAESQSVTIRPTISSVPDGKVYVCWGLYYDAACTSEVPDVRFTKVLHTGPNIVRVTMPATAGTYFVKTSLNTGKACLGTIDSYLVTPLAVHPSDADVMLMRDAQLSGEKVTLNDGKNLKAYGAMRFNRSTLNNDALTTYERYNYFISFPFDVQLADIYGLGTIGTHWRICYYDGKGRAEEGFFAERTTNWVPFDDTDSVLHAGQGYLLQLNATHLAEDKSTLWPHDADIATLFFPALSSIEDITVANETIPALGDAYRCAIDLSASLGSDEGDRRTKDSYWRCLGVPSFASPAGVNGLPYLYQWDTEDNSLEVVSSTDFSFLPAHAYLVQNGNEIVWTGAEKPLYGLAAQQRTTHEDNFYEFCLELHQQSQRVDQTYIRVTDDEAVTADFDFGYDLIKERNANKPNLYSMVGYERLAANCLPIQNTLTRVPIGVEVPQSGSYTFTMPAGTHGIELTLFDKQATSTLLSAGNSYSVELEEGSYPDRFYLEISPVKTLPTDVYHSDSTTAASKVLIDGQLFILRSGIRYNLQGLQVK